MKKIEVLHKNIILKMEIIKETKSGIILPLTQNGTKLKDNDGIKHKPVAEVYAIGDQVTKVKPGDMVFVTKPSFIVLDMDKLIGLKCGEEAGFNYMKVTEEDIFGIIK